MEAHSRHSSWRGPFSLRHEVRYQVRELVGQLQVAPGAGQVAVGCQVIRQPGVGVGGEPLVQQATQVLTMGFFSGHAASLQGVLNPLNPLGVTEISWEHPCEGLEPSQGSRP